MPRILDAVRTFLAEHHPSASSGPRLGIAVSGGIDSMVLLDVVTALSPEMGFTATVLHFDHMWRPDSGEDRKFVEKAAERLGLAFRWDGGIPEQTPGDSPEERARSARYEFLERMADEERLTALLTGHTADDQAETLLFRFLRGSGLRGLCGIPPVRCMRNGALLLRPLLEVRRSEIERFARARGISFREDPSNASLVHERNRIRHRVLPFLIEQSNPGLVERLCVTAEIVRREDEFLDGVTREDLMRWESHGERYRRRTEELKALHPAVLYRSLHGLFGRLGVYPSFEAIERTAVLVTRVGRIDLTKSLAAWSDAAGWIWLGPPEATAQRVDGAFEVAREGETIIAPLDLHVQVAEHAHRPGTAEMKSRTVSGAAGVPFSASVQIAAESVRGALRLRYRREGDRMTPMGLKGSKKLQDIFIDEKVPLGERDRWPLLCDDEGVLWIMGLRQDERTRIGDDTSNVLRIEVARRPSEDPELTA